MAEQFLTFDDILIAPAYSDIESRSEVSTEVEFLGHNLTIPIISANMDFVTGVDMAIAMHRIGGLGILHRFWGSEMDYVEAMAAVAKSETPLWISVGVRDVKDSLDFIKHMSQDLPIAGVCIDVAHGHHKKVGELTEMIKGNPDESIANIKVIAGNVATEDGVSFLANSGADAVKIGIGAGSVCTTRTVAGVGVPQWSAILECAEMRDEFPGLQFIADGGIRNSGDIAKALAAGADVVMLGNMIAGTDEAPGEIVNYGLDWGVQKMDGTYETTNPAPKYKRYRGQASFGENEDRYIKEGIDGMVPYKGPVEPILRDIKRGLQSSMSYTGSRNLGEFRELSKFVQVSSHTLMENNTRVQER